MLYVCFFLFLFFQVKFFSGVDLSETNSVSLPDTVLDMSTYGGNHLVLGSTSIQLVDLNELEKRQTIADNVQDDENLVDPPLHLTQFGPKGKMATASVENNTVKLWPHISLSSDCSTHPENRIKVGGASGTGYIYRCVSCVCHAA